MDDFSKLLVIEEVRGKSLPNEIETKEQVINSCIDELRKMLEKNAKKEFTIDEGHYEQGKIPDYLEGDNIKERIHGEICEYLFEKFDYVSDFERLLIMEEGYNSLPLDNELRKERVNKCINELRRMLKKLPIVDETFYKNEELQTDLSDKELKNRIKIDLQKYKEEKRKIK